MLLAAFLIKSMSLTTVRWLVVVVVVYAAGSMLWAARAKRPRRPKRKNSHALESKIEMSQAARSGWSTACKLETLPSRCAQIAAVLILAGTAAVAQEPATFKAQAPELEERSQAEWINSKPLKLSQLHGQVVILHFWTFGCINCQHNYPTLKAWQKAFAKKGVTIIGVHTPETSAEHNNQNVRKSAEKTA